MQLVGSNDGANGEGAWTPCSPVEIEAAREVDVQAVDAAGTLRELAALVRSLLNGTAGVAEREAIARIVGTVEFAGNSVPTA